MDVEGLRVLLASKAIPSGAAFAAKHGLSAGYVNEVIRGTREPGAKILSALDLEKIVTYRKRKA